MHTPNEDHAGSDSTSSLPRLPRPPSPSKDAGIVPDSGLTSEDSDEIPDLENIDIFTLKPVAALKLLCGTVEGLASITGDVPPTPPINLPGTPSLGLTQNEKENVAQYTKGGRRFSSGIADSAADIDGVPPRAKTPIGSPEAHPAEPLHIIGSNVEPLNIQHGAITRKFYSKKPPPIGLEEYLMRLHKYCPMSTAVYLATSLYIYRLAVVEKIIPVADRNVHRLVLAGLRIAMKALEDLSYPHRRFAKVGGVSESELGRLEISFCFLTNFELKVDKGMLLTHAKTIRDAPFPYNLPAKFQPILPLFKEKRTSVVSRSKPDAVLEAPAVA